MNGGVWYEQSLRWTPASPVQDQDLMAWWRALDGLDRPSRLLVNPVVHQALQHRALQWPTHVRWVDTLLTPDDVPAGLNAWASPPAAWGWLWRASLHVGQTLPAPEHWPRAPSFKAEMIADPRHPWPHPGTWWLHWVTQDALRDVPLDVWLDERDGLNPEALNAWDRWTQQVDRLARRSDRPVKPWAQDADGLDDPRWRPANHHVWTPQGWAPDVPFWTTGVSVHGLVPAPCERCAAATCCPGPHQPARWATPDGVCSQGRSWRLERLGTAR